MVMGTPGYISPEQARGRAVDHRTDIYALGCMAFQMVTGRLPFPAESAMDMIALHLTQPAPRASVQRAGLSPTLDDLIHAMMSKRAEDRPSLEAIRGSIAALLEQMGVASKSSTGDPRKAAFKPRLVTPPPGVVVSLPGMDPKGPEALMATAAPGEPILSSGHMRVHRADLVVVEPTTARSTPSLPVLPRHPRRLWLVVGGIALGAVAVAVAARFRPHPVPVA